MVGSGHVGDKDSSFVFQTVKDTGDVASRQLLAHHSNYILLFHSFITSYNNFHQISIFDSKDIL